jgi:hypothetical protein
MAGTKIFKSDCYFLRTGLTFPQGTNVFFKLTWDFFKQMETAGYVTEIARNNGAAATFSPKPLGTDFYDGTAPFGEHCWAVFRFNPSTNRTFPYYVFFQCSSSNNFGTAPGNPGLFLGGVGSISTQKIGFQMAWGIDGGLPANPWGGTTGSLGSDTKGDPVWINPGAGTGFVFPLSNNPGNTHSTSRQNTVGYSSGNSTGVFRFNFVGDEDNWFIDINYNDSFSENFYCGGGYYESLSNITSESPIFMFSSTATLDRTNTWGSSAGNTIREGGITVKASSAVGALSLGWDSSLEREEFNDNFDGIYPRFLLHNLKVNHGNNHVGYADPTFWGASYGNQPRDVFGVNREYITTFIGDFPSPTVSKLVVPWNGNWSRGRSTSLQGVILP